jgi:hypothetical protein
LRLGVIAVIHTFKMHLTFSIEKQIVKNIQMKPKTFLIRLAILVMIFAVTAGCKSYFKYKFGMAEPGEETPESLIAFLKKNSFPSGNMYMFSDSAAYFQALRNPVFIKKLLSHLNFNRDGLLLSSDTTKCQWSGYDVIKALRPDSTYPTVPGLLLDEILRHIKPFGNSPVNDSMTGKPDYTVIVTWGKFIGKYNYRLFDLSGAVNENKAAKIRLIWLNLDLQKSWHLTKHQKISFR